MHLEQLFGFKGSCSAPAHLFPWLVEVCRNRLSSEDGKEEHEQKQNQTDSSPTLPFGQAVLPTYPCFVGTMHKNSLLRWKKRKDKKQQPSSALLYSICHSEFMVIRGLTCPRETFRKASNV